MPDAGTHDPISGKTNPDIKVPYVFLIILDTVRVNSLSIYDGNKGLGINIENFSKNAVIYDNCITASSWTLPSHASLFTGLYSVEHGAHRHKAKNKVLPRPLQPGQFTTLADIFNKNGYLSAGIVSNNVALNPGLKINQGFQIYDCVKNIGALNPKRMRPLIHLFSFITNIKPEFNLHYRPAEEINRKTYALLNKVEPSPFFCFINYMDAHHPYQPPRPFNGYFLDSNFPDLYKIKSYFLRLLGKLPDKTWDAYLLSQYEGEIACLDDQFGKLINHLKKIGIYDQSLIVVSSDHGELFGEHGLYRHKGELYQETVNTPLIIKYPFRKKTGRDKRLIAFPDLYPTILSICGLNIPENISGQALFANLPVVTELYNLNDKKGCHRAIYNGKYKLMRYDNPNKKPELYDLVNDPKEQNNLAQKLPEMVSELTDSMNRWKEKHKLRYTKPEKKSVLPKEVEDGLKALGYIQ